MSTTSATTMKRRFIIINHLSDFKDHFYDFKGPSNTSCLRSQWGEQDSFELYVLRASLTVLLNPAK